MKSTLFTVFIFISLCGLAQRPVTGGDLAKMPRPTDTGNHYFSSLHAYRTDSMLRRLCGDSVLPMRHVRIDSISGRFVKINKRPASGKGWNSSVLKSNVQWFTVDDQGARIKKLEQRVAQLSKKLQKSQDIQAQDFLMLAVKSWKIDSVRRRLDSLCREFELHRNDPKGHFEVWTLHFNEDLIFKKLDSLIKDLRAQQLPPLSQLYPNNWPEHSDTLFSWGRNKGDVRTTILIKSPESGWYHLDKLDTVVCWRFISDVRKSTFLHQRWKEPFMAQLYDVRDSYGHVGYLNRLKKPLPVYWKVWNLEEIFPITQ